MGQRTLDSLDDPRQERERLFAAPGSLVDRGLIEPVDTDDARQLRAWQDMDLAIMAEDCFGVRVHPRQLTADDSVRAEWLARMGDAYTLPGTHGDRWSRPCWLLRDGARVGSIVLGYGSTGPSLVSVAGLYVLSEHRGADIAGRVLRAFHHGVCAQGFHGLRLETCWVWQPTVRYYLRRGFWVYFWKRDLTLYWDDRLPGRYALEFTPTTARFIIWEGDAAVELFLASRAGDLLVLEESARARRAGAEDDLRLLTASISTFALGLAVAGWPLYQSTADQHEGWSGDAGSTGSLAARIEAYEALARHRGWIVDTPRLPGLAYRTYAELFENSED